MAIDPSLQYELLDSVKEACDALASLNGEDLNNFVVSAAPGGPEDEIFWSGNAMIVAGGKDDSYYCRAYVANDTRSPYWVATKRNAKRTGETIPIKTGQVEDVPRHCVINRDEAREALIAFIESGGLTDALSWEPEVSINDRA